MPSIANLSIRSLYDTAADFLALYAPHTPSWSVRRPTYLPTFHNPADSKSSLDPDSPLSDSPTLAVTPSPTRSYPSLFSSSSMRRELDYARNELAKSRAEQLRLEERCKVLERTLKDTRELLHVRDSEVEKHRKARVHERLMMSERRHSDINIYKLPHDPNVPLYKPPHLRKETRHGSLDLDRRNTVTGAVSRGPTPTRQLNSNGHVSGQPNGLTNGHSPTPSDNVHQRALELAGSEERARIRANETYMTRTDSWSGAQVLQAVHDINSEILQFAASATDLCTFDRDSRPSSARAVQAMHDTSSRLGSNLARILSNRDHSQDPILVQLALQGCVAICINRALASFCIGFSAKTDTVLSQIYTKMVVAEPQPTSSKWRALAHRHIHLNYPNLAENSVNDLVDAILRWSADIFLIAGCSSYETPTTSSKEALRQRFGDQIRRIAKAVIRLARVTREEIMSTCFDVVAVNEADSFDANQMSDMFGGYVASRGAIIVTTELGLRCTTRIQNPEHPELQEGVMQQRVILQPKVVLESVLDVLDPR